MIDKKNLIVEFSSVLSNFLLISNEKDAEISSRLGISVGEFRCLYLFLNKSEYGIKDLIQGLRVSSSRLSRILDGLEEKGIVSRSIDLKDHRNFNIALTQKGIEIIKEIKVALLENCQLSLEGISVEAIETTIRVLRQLLNSYLLQSQVIKSGSLQVIANTLCDGGKKL